MWITFCKKGLPRCETISFISYNLHNFKITRIHIMEINMSISMQDNLAQFKGRDYFDAVISTTELAYFIFKAR